MSAFAMGRGWRGKIAEGEDIGGAGGEDLDSLHGGCQSTTLPVRCGVATAETGEIL